jgi:hypothetical protein
MISELPLQFLSTACWRNLAAEHRLRALQHTAPARKRRDCGVPHPVEDFLFDYYPYPLTLLENWHPGIGYALECKSEVLPATFAPQHHTIATGIFFADPKFIAVKQRERLRWVRQLLAATQQRAPNFACHGLHEWAMVYRGKTVRHGATTPLRLTQPEIDAVVESRAICCSHFDAFRFFTPESKLFNRQQPTLDQRTELEQPGCVHANMDLYKWAAKAMPWVGSVILIDCFELALKLRDLDMRASPYDLSAWGLEPILIETTAGREIYVTEQKRLASGAHELRGRLLVALARALG